MKTLAAVCVVILVLAMYGSRIVDFLFAGFAVMVLYLNGVVQ